MDDNLNLEGNTEIKKALEEFDVKSREKEISQTGAILEAPLMQPKHEVEGVKFETDSYGAVKFYNQTIAPKMIKSVMKWSGGAIKEERQAEYVLLGFVIVAIIISLFLFFRGTGQEAKIEAPPGQRIIYPENGPPRLEKQF